MDDELGVSLCVEVGRLDGGDVTPADLLTLVPVEPREQVEPSVDLFRGRHFQVVTGQRVRETPHVSETDLIAWRSCKKQQQTSFLKIDQMTFRSRLLSGMCIDLIFHYTISQKTVK